MDIIVRVDLFQVPFKFDIGHMYMAYFLFIRIYEYNRKNYDWVFVLGMPIREIYVKNMNDF